MTKTETKHDDGSHSPKKHDCCGGGHAKDRAAESAPKASTAPESQKQKENVHRHSDSAGCCGNSNAKR